MRNTTKLLAAASMLAAISLAAPSLYAQGEKPPSGSPSGPGMMRDGMMGQGGMGMMQQMTQMMESCNKMMSARRDSGGGQKEDQKPTPSDPEKKG